MNKRQLFILALFFFRVVELTAQNYPVQSSVVLTPPYSVRLANYTSPLDGRLKINLLYTDLQSPSIDVKLKLTIKGQGVQLQTSSTANVAPITLQSGFPKTLTGPDLSAYFDVNNLTFQGYSRNKYKANAMLPDGHYYFCVEVMEYRRKVPLSVQSCANAWMVLNDPPTIVTPRHKDTVKAAQPQNIVFQWQPGHTGSPNSAFSVEYLFELVEVFPSTRNPNDAILTTPPLYTQSTMNTMLIYTMTHPALVLGRNYAVRVTARDIQGRDLFKNEGQSQVVQFTYGEECLRPYNLSTTEVTTRTAKVDWKGYENHLTYDLKIRAKSTEQHPWVLYEGLAGPDSLISSLSANTTYEVQVRSRCYGAESPYSNLLELTTIEKPDYLQDLTCGESVTLQNPGSYQPLSVLLPGDELLINDFDVNVIDATGGMGTFSGIGTVKIGSFNGTFLVQFKDIKINSRYEVVSGTVNGVIDPHKDEFLIDQQMVDQLGGIAGDIEMLMKMINAQEGDTAFYFLKLGEIKNELQELENSLAVVHGGVKDKTAEAQNKITLAKNALKNGQYQRVEMYLKEAVELLKSIEKTQTVPEKISELLKLLKSVVKEVILDMKDANKETLASLEKEIGKEKEVLVDITIREKEAIEQAGLVKGGGTQYLTNEKDVSKKEEELRGEQETDLYITTIDGVKEKLLEINYRKYTEEYLSHLEEQEELLRTSQEVEAEAGELLEGLQQKIENEEDIADLKTFIAGHIEEEIGSTYEEQADQ